MIKKILHILIISVGSLAVLLLLIVYLSPYIDPLSSWYFSVLALAYPLILLANIILLFISFLFKRKIFRYILLLVILGGYMYHHRFFAFHFMSKKDIQTGDIRMLSYNVKTFDLYNWSNNVNSRQKIIHFVDSVKPDIACFQEYIIDDRKVVNATDTLSKLLQINYIHQSFPRNNRYFHFGMATFSRYPIVRKKEIIFKHSQNFVLITDVVKDKDTIRLFNCHLQSIHLGVKEYNFLDSIPDNIDKKKFKEVPSLLKLLRKAYRKRARQVAILKDSLDSSPYPVILCGDFNDVPNSYTYQTLSQNLYDSFLESGNGFGATYTNFFIPYRIDYILYDSHFESVFSEKIEIPYSDHFPYFTVLRMTKP